MSKVCFEAIVHSLSDSKPAKDGTTFKLQVSFKDDEYGYGKISEHRFTAPFKGPTPAMLAEGDDCGASSWLVFGYYRIEQKTADTYLGSSLVKIHRGVEISAAEHQFKTDDSGIVSMKVSVRDVTAEKAYANSSSAPNAAASGGKSGGDSSVIPMLSIDDVFDSHEAQTDSGESVKNFAKDLATQFDVSSHNVEELAFVTMRICDFPVHYDAAQIPSLPLDPEIIQTLGMHPSEFKKLRENLNSALDAAGMHAYYDVLKRKSDISNLYHEKDFEWDSDTISRWNHHVSNISNSDLQNAGKQYDEHQPLAVTTFQDIVDQWNEADAREIKLILENVMRQQTLPGTVKIAVHGIKNLPASKSQTPGTFHATICFGGTEILRLPDIAGHAPNMWKATTVSKLTGLQPNENSNFFEVAVFLKKKFAFRPHLIGAARITTADFLSCLEAKELCFELQKPGRTENRGELVVTLQFDVSHKDAESAIEAVRPGHYKKLALQLINRVVIHTLKELPKNAEYSGIPSKWQNVIDQFLFRHGVRSQWTSMKLLDITSSIYKSFPVDPKVIENAVLYFIESQDLVLSPSPKAEASDFQTIVPKIWEGILKSFRYYWTLRGGMRMKLTRSLIEMLSASENDKIQDKPEKYMLQLGEVIKEAARINFLRVKDSIPGEFSISKLNEILKACIAELSSDAKMFDSNPSFENSLFEGNKYFKSIAHVFWFGGVEIKSIHPDGSIVTLEHHNCSSKDAVVLTGCLPEWISQNEVVYSNITSPTSMSFFRAKNVPGKQVLMDVKPEKCPVMRVSKLGANGKAILKTVDIESVSLSTGVFTTVTDHGFSDGDHLSLAGYVPHPFWGKKLLYAAVKESDKRTFMLSLVHETPPVVSLFYKAYLRKESEMSILSLLEEKLNSGALAIDESLFDLYTTIEDVWDFLVQHGVVQNVQKVDFEVQFKMLFLKWTDWVDGRLREMISNAVKQEKPITEADQSDSIICTSTEDTMTMVRMFLSKYMSSDLARRYTPTMLEKFGGAFAFYVDQIQSRAVESLSQMENTWGKYNDPVYTAIRNGNSNDLREALKTFKKDGFSLSRWVGAAKIDTRGGVFHVAAKYHQYDDGLLQVLKEEKCHPNAQDSLQRTCIHTLVQQLVKSKGSDNTEKQKEAAKFLDELFRLFPDVNVNILDHTSQTPLQILSASKSESDFIKDVRRKIESRSSGQEQTLFSPVLDVFFCAHVNSILYILNNAPDLMQEHVQSGEDEGEDTQSSGDDLIYNALRTLRKHCRAACSSVLRKAFQILCNTVIFPVLTHVIGGVKVEPSSEIDKAKSGLVAGFKAIKKAVPGIKGDADQAQPKYFDRDVIQRDSSYMIKAIQEQMMGPIVMFISEGETGPVNGRVKQKRLKFVRDAVLPEFWHCILATVESFLLPILNDESNQELSIYDAKLLQKLVFDLLPQVFALHDSESEVALGLDDEYFKRHSATNRLKILFALYCVPVRRLCDMHGKLLQDEGIRRAWNIQPVDVLRIIRSWRNKHDIAKEYLKKSGSQNEDWELCLKFGTADTERRIASFPDVEEISGGIGLATTKGCLYLLTSYLICEWKSTAVTRSKDPVKIKLTDLKHFEHDSSSSGSDKLLIHYVSSGLPAILSLRVRAAADIIVPARQAAVSAGNRRVKEFVGTADERNALRKRLDLSSDEFLAQQYPCVLSDISDTQQKSGTAYMFQRRLIFEANSDLLVKSNLTMRFQYDKTQLKQSSEQPLSLKCRRETGETYRLSFKDEKSCAAVCQYCEEAKEVIAKDKMTASNLIKIWLPADEGTGGQSSKTFKVLPEDTIRSLLDQVRSKMMIEEDEMLQVAIEGPIPFQPGLDETVLNVNHDLKELGVYDQSKWSVISDKTHSVNAVLFLKNPYWLAAGAGIDSGVVWAGQYSVTDASPHKNLYYRKYDAAKVSDPSFLKSSSDSQKRGCVGFRFIQKDRSNIRPFVSFSEPVFICPDIKDRSLDVVLNLVQVVHSSQTGKIRIDAGFDSPSGQIRLGDVVRIKSSEGSYLCADISKPSSFDAKNVFNFSMYSKEFIDKNPKIVYEFTIRDERGRDKGTAVLTRKTAIGPRPSASELSNASLLRPSLAGKPKDVSDAELSYTSVADQGPSFSCELGAGFPPRLRGQQGSLCVTSESLKFQPSKSSFADISVILLRDIQKVEASHTFFVPNAIVVHDNNNDMGCKVHEFTAFKDASDRAACIKAINTILKADKISKS